MRAPYCHINIIERARIEALKAEGLSNRKIAKRLGRSPNTISLELKKCPEEDYETIAAQEYTNHLRFKCGVERRKLDQQHCDFLSKNLTKTVTVSAIIGRLKLENKKHLLPVSITTCYRFIKIKPVLWTLLPHRNRRTWGTAKDDARTKVFKDVKNISERSQEANDRLELGHREADLVCGPRNGSKEAVFVTIDRFSRHYIGRKLLYGKDADGVEDIAIKSHNHLKIKSITSDRGREFARWQAIEEGLKTSFYMANPHAPWEKPSVEWCNGLLRRFFIKGTDFAKVESHQLQLAIQAINHTPRKCLDWETPHEKQFGVKVSYFK